MSRRANDIRKQIAKRRKLNYSSRENSFFQEPAVFRDEDGIEKSVYESVPDESIHPLWNRNLFLLKILCSAALVLLVAIIFKSPSPAFEQVRSSVKASMEKEFQFAAVSNWYEGKFGKPLALLPEKNTENPVHSSEQVDYAVPVSGKILAQFSDDGRGIILETGTGAEVKTMTGGIVVFAGNKEDIGHTVIIQHPDQSESWYGKLDAISVKPREKVEAGKIIGTVSSGKEGKVGEFYFAIKQENEFIDPIQVMNFE
ncbi:M23 family metallopeptidase [Lederbergia citrea]|uniref:M23 family metallopeptidase n=1 Tax=Lederbergia citrea TaxID=2833581 RepID=A0A942UNH2_9BACI|nr:M23 family metallopeptidase [Lederbergia citrea]MBS4222572.1 M23 family metallopeptidase [Lederbergia citrea]